MTLSLQDHGSAKPLTALSALAVALVALSGCLGASDGLETNEAPVARLAVDATERYAGEAFRFAANGSEDPDGAVARYAFAFGDGTTFETTNATQAANVTHTYETGGLYAVVLTVTDDGHGDANESRSHSTTTLVAVHERHVVTEAAQTALPDSGPANTTFAAGENASAFALNLTVRALPGIGATVLTLHMWDDNGTELQNQTVTLDAGEVREVTFQGNLTGNGTYTLVRHVSAGGAVSNGILDVRYGPVTYRTA